MEDARAYGAGVCLRVLIIEYRRPEEICRQMLTGARNTSRESPGGNRYVKSTDIGMHHSEK